MIAPAQPPSYRRHASFRTLGLLCALVCTAPAMAQRMVAVSTALTATREAARVYVHSIDATSCGLLPGAYPLAGIATTGDPAAIADGRAVVLTTRDRWPGIATGALPTQTWWHVIRTSPFAHRPAVTVPGEPGWREWVAATIAAPGGGDLIISLGEHIGAAAPLQGKIEVWRYDPATLARSLIHEHRIAEIPAAAVAVAGTPPFAVIVSGRGTATTPQVLHMDLQSGLVTHAALDTPAALSDTYWDPVAVAWDGHQLLILTTGYTLGASRGERVSWLHALDGATLQPRAVPLQLPGRPAKTAICPIDGGGAWIATQTPGSGFAHVSRVALSAGPSPSLQAAREIPQGGVLDSVLVAPDPAAPGARLAVAFDQRVVLWSETQGVVQQHAFENPVRVLQWRADGLFAAEGPSLHRLDTESLAPTSFTQTPGGWITDVVHVPADPAGEPDQDCDGLRDASEAATGSDPANPDSDADGLSDGADPSPLQPTPQLSLPAGLALRGEAAGRALRGLPVTVEQGAAATWRVHVADPVPPWLVLHPRTGRGSGVVYLGVDPSVARNEDAVAEVQVLLHPEAALGPTVGSPARTRIEVTPNEQDVRRILWVWGADTAHSTGTSFRASTDPQGLGALGDLLAGAPFLFSHVEAHGPYSGELTDYSVVVLTAAAAAQGALTRQAVLDFVAGGGALLFLGAYLGEASPPGLETWLAPLDIQIMADVRVDGRYAGAGDAYLLRHWKDFEIQAGCAIRAAQGHTLTPGGKRGGGAVFVAREYGYGRIALLASSTPLRSDAVRRSGERRFAQDLFRWLGRAGLEVDDADGDGLPDGIEDRNNNGALDPGETDYLNPDTDNDGIPDGLEDANRNGEVDEGETDPRSPDTDGDGLLDGGDPQPYAAFGAPLINSVTAAGGGAAEGPAEGGTLLYLKGRNFSVDNHFWIGAQRAPWQTILDASQALVRTPENTGEPGGVSVRVVSPATGLERTLPQGFRYTPRNTVTLALTAGDEVVQDGDRLRGVVYLRVTDLGGAALGRVAAVLRVTPADGFAWEAIVPGAAVPASGVGWLARPLEEGRLLLGAQLDSSPMPTIIAACHWVLDPAPARPAPLHVEVETLTASTPYGGALNVAISPAPLMPVPVEPPGI
jgi:hypothetical protein